MKGLAVLLAVIFALAGVLSILHPLEPSGLTSALGFASDKAHVKHPFAYFALAVLSLIWLRFQSAASTR
jgi:hypothetical protein